MNPASICLDAWTYLLRKLAGMQWEGQEKTKTDTQFVNRSVGRMLFFRRDADFEASQRVLIESHQRHPIHILSYCGFVGQTRRVARAASRFSDLSAGYWRRQENRLAVCCLSR